MALFRMDRARESAPIVLSLIKDTGWCYSLGIVSVITIIPVLTFQVYEIWKCRKEGANKIVQNIMATLALSANITWMLSDLYFGERYRHYAKWMFFFGMLFLVIYGLCLLLLRKPRKVAVVQQRTMTVSKSTRGLVFVHSPRRLDHMEGHRSGLVPVRRRRHTRS